MKIETPYQTWKSIIVTIETLEEARELYRIMDNSYNNIQLLKELFEILTERT